jgi:TnpA family transposase
VPARSGQLFEPPFSIGGAPPGGQPRRAPAGAITVLARYGSAARGDPLYEAMVQVGKLLRTVFLCDYFVNEAFRRELLRVLNRG